MRQVTRYGTIFAFCGALMGCNSSHLSESSNNPSEPTQAKAEVAQMPAAQAEKMNTVRWGLPVAYDPTGDPSLEGFASDLTVGLGTAGPIRVRGNPGCCMWLEIDHWNPYPSNPGYVILIQQGGAVVRATNAEQMSQAVQRILRSRKGLDLPEGVMSNYPTIDDR